MAKIQDTKPASGDYGVMRDANGLTKYIVYSADDLREFWPAPSKAELRAESAKLRWAKEQGGIVINGVTVSTDATSQMKINAARTAYDNGALSAQTAIDFKAKSGWVSVNRQQLAAIYAAIVAHVQNCYSIERTVDEEIEAGKVTTVDQVAAYYR